MWWLPALVLGACVPMEPSGNVVAPVKTDSPDAVGAGAGSVGAGSATRSATPARPLPGGKTARLPQGDFDFEAEDRDAALFASTPPSDDPIELQAKLLGISVEEARRQASGPPGGAAPAVPPVAAPLWDPSVTIPEASFGIRVLAVVLDLQPPRAVIALPDGREQVVTPGAMLPAEGLVVLAIGRDAVQVAKVTPSGFYARVETDTIRALYPSQSQSP